MELQQKFFILEFFDLFVDDIIALNGTSQEQITNLYWLLRWSKAILKLKIKLEKSKKCIRR